MTEQQVKISISGHLRNKRGIYHMVTNYINRNGKRIEESKSTQLEVKGNKKRAEKMLAQLILEKERALNEEIGNSDDTPLAVLEPEQIELESKNLFADFILDWLDQIKTSIAQSTFIGYYRVTKNVIAPYFREKNIALTDLKPRDIQLFYRYKMDVDGVTANTAIHYHALIRKSLQYAYVTDLIPSNPADKVERPKKGVFLASYYGREELVELFNCINGDPIAPAVILGAFYGLRRSEVLGLKWSAIDFSNKKLTINHTVTELYFDGKINVIAKDSTKNKSSYRSLPLVAPVENYLRRLKAEQSSIRAICGKAYCTDFLDYIMVDKLGHLMKANYISQHFGIIQKKYGLKKIRFHDLRHSCASLLYARGVSMTDIQKWLGHSSILTTNDFYAHLDFVEKVKTANSIVDIIDF